uniref:Uncharacterized protein n=1 Tax=Sphaerodactylus townsendi TaxID=933632 RepID=A0ACB8ESN3_9SAUR
MPGGTGTILPAPLEQACRTRNVPRPPAAAEAEDCHQRLLVARLSSGTRLPGISRFTIRCEAGPSDVRIPGSTIARPPVSACIAKAGRSLQSFDPPDVLGSLRQFPHQPYLWEYGQEDDCPPHRRPPAKISALF